MSVVKWEITEGKGEIQMKKRMTGMLMVAALSMPLVGFAGANVQMGGGVGKLNLAEKQLRHEQYKFMILAKEGELEVKGGKSCELELSGHIKSVGYQAMAPNRDFGAMTMQEFCQGEESLQRNRLLVIEL